MRDNGCTSTGRSKGSWSWERPDLKKDRHTLYNSRWRCTDSESPPQGSERLLELLGWWLPKPKIIVIH